MSSLGTWVKSIVSEPAVPHKTSSQAISESLLSEMDCLMKDIEAEQRNKQAEERRKSCGVDYSWLMATHPKNYEMPQLERLELEELTLKVKPEEYASIISLFKDAVEARKPEVSEVPRLMRTVVYQVIEGRPREETMSEWMTKSLTNLAKYRPKSSKRITPISILADQKDMETASATKTQDIFTVSGSTSSSLVESIEQLPV